MSHSAHILVTAGPDEGQAFPLTEDLVHIGRGAENQIVLTDESLADHHFSLVRRNGRFAVYAASSDALDIDGHPVPAERWVWVPEAATIHCGGGTALSLQAALHSPNGAADVPTRTSAEDTPASAPAGPRTGEGSSGSVVRRRRSAFKRERSHRGSRRDPGRSSVARFITDQPGDPLVKLGADGQLPQLRLKESEDVPAGEAASSSDSNPLVLYGILACSLVLSVGMLLIEPGGSGISSKDTSAARVALEPFYGQVGGELQPYQILLREALVAHSQGDRKAEQQAYRQVLRMLNSADITDPENFNGLTGRTTRRGRASDEDLREALQTLLAE